MNTARCIHCGHPCEDHRPLRYVLRAWIAHRAAQPRAWLDRKLWRRRQMRITATILAITGIALLINIAAAWTYLELHDGPEFPY